MIARIIIPQTPKWFETRHKYLKRIIDRWDGYTYWEGIGGWKDHKGKTKREPVIILDVYVPADTQVNRQWWTSFADRVRGDLHQDCVYLQFTQADVQFVGEETESKDEDRTLRALFPESFTDHDIGGEG